MELKKVKEIPKTYVKEILKSLSKLERLKEIPFFTGIHFKEAEGELNDKINTYKKVELQANRVWRTVELSRNQERPQFQEYIKGIFFDCVELAGDRLSAEDPAIFTGLATINNRTIAVIGHNKGKDLKEKVKYNFGSSKPQGYRKTQRIMELADRFGFPIVIFIDTPGAFSGPEAEDDGQASAIAHNIQLMFKVKVPVVAVLIGEGGSGGALALAIGNEVAILENSTYSVISPEGCAAILWKNPESKKLAARALKITARDLYALGVVDRIIHEPLGGAQNDPKRMVRIVKKYISNALYRLEKLSSDELKSAREKKFESMGFFN